MEYADEPQAVVLCREQAAGRRLHELGSPRRTRVIDLVRATSGYSRSAGWTGPARADPGHQRRRAGQPADPSALRRRQDLPGTGRRKSVSQGVGPAEDRRASRRGRPASLPCTSKPPTGNDGTGNRPQRGPQSRDPPSAGAGRAQSPATETDRRRPVRLGTLPVGAYRPLSGGGRELERATADRPRNRGRRPPGRKPAAAGSRGHCHAAAASAEGGKRRRCRW